MDILDICADFMYNNSEFNMTQEVHMEYSGKKRSSLMLIVIMWLLLSGYIFLKATPHQIPLRMMMPLEFFRYSLVYIIFSLGVLILGFVREDRPLLFAVASCSVAVLCVLMCRDAEIEHELLAKVRDNAVAFFVLPHWGWTRVLKENTQGIVAGWCAFSGSIAFFAACAVRK